MAVNASGNPPEQGAMLDVSSTSMGFLPPRMTTSQRDAISNPPEGLTIYNTDVKCLEYYRGVLNGWYSACPVLAQVTTNTVSGIGISGATSGGEVVTDGGASVSVRGVCWNTSSGPTINDNFTTDGNGTGIFSSSITGLTAGTTYYVRAYATNNVGVAYGNEFSFTTLDYPTVVTVAVSGITFNDASSGGNVLSDGGSAVTDRGICWSINPSPTTSDATTSDGTGTGSYTSSLSGLTPGTMYYVRAFAINSVGTSYGNEETFGTPGLLYFTSSGSNYWTVPSGVTTLMMTVVGGGGGGGGDVGGGGGGGQVVNVSSYSVTAGQTLTINVAAQTDYPQSYNYYGRDGENSSVSGGNGGTITATGGNGGRGRNGGGPGANNGWNGGGGSYDYNAGNSGNGGSLGGNAYTGRSAGGGGGSGGNGQSASYDAGGDGGVGIVSIIDGIYYGGGGGGGEYQGNAGGTGIDGGGTGGRTGNSPPGTDGIANRGGGGGGGGSTGNFPNSGRGSSGVVIISYVAN